MTAQSVFERSTIADGAGQWEIVVGQSLHFLQKFSVFCKKVRDVRNVIDRGDQN